MSTVSSDSEQGHATNNPALVVVVWLAVVLPLAWGVYNTVKTSAKLFEEGPAATTSAPATATASATAAASAPVSTSAP